MLVVTWSASTVMISFWTVFDVYVAFLAVVLRCSRRTVGCVFTFAYITTGSAQALTWTSNVESHACNASCMSIICSLVALNFVLMTPFLMFYDLVSQNAELEGATLSSPGE